MRLSKCVGTGSDFLCNKKILSLYEVSYKDRTVILRCHLAYRNIRSLMRKPTLPLLCNGSSRRILLRLFPFRFALKSPFLHPSTASSHHRILSVSFTNEVLFFLIGLANCSTKVSERQPILKRDIHTFFLSEVLSP